MTYNHIDESRQWLDYIITYLQELYILAGGGVGKW